VPLIGFIDIVLMTDTGDSKQQLEKWTDDQAQKQSAMPILFGSTQQAGEKDQLEVCILYLSKRKSHNSRG
jgi:hypothetical protein